MYHYKIDGAEKMPTNYRRNETSENMLKVIKEFIDANGGIVKKEQFAQLHIDYRRILDFLSTGDLVRIKNGYYTDRMDRFTEEMLIARLFPDARLCMESALYVYGYLKKPPYGWRLAVDKNTSKSRFKMDYPKVIPFYTEEESLDIGSTTITYKGETFQIYEKERVICDCLKYESKMERDDFKQAIQAYIKDDKKDISLLLEYARERKVVQKVQNLIGVWL